MFSHTTTQPEKFPLTAELHIVIDRDHRIVLDNTIIPFLEGDSTGTDIFVAAGWEFDIAVISVAAGTSDLKYLKSAIWRSRNAQPPDRSPKFDRLTYHYDGLATFMQMLPAQLPSASKT